MLKENGNIYCRSHGREWRDGSILLSRCQMIISDNDYAAAIIIFEDCVQRELSQIIYIKNEMIVFLGTRQDLILEIAQGNYPELLYPTLPFADTILTYYERHQIIELAK